MAKHKGKLNLTVASDARARAEALAKKQRRSLSTLFEKLVDDEWNRENGVVAEDAGQYGKQPPKPEKTKKIGFQGTMVKAPTPAVIFTAGKYDGSHPRPHRIRG